MKKSSTPTVPPFFQQDKDKSDFNQLQTIFSFLKDHVATASMVTEATGIAQKNICRYKRDLEKADMLWEIEKKDCQKTGYKAWYLTTDRTLAPVRKAIQLSLFDSPTNSISV